MQVHTVFRFSLFCAGAVVFFASLANRAQAQLVITEGTTVATSAADLGGGSVTLAGGNLQLVGDSGVGFGNATTVSSDGTIVSDRATLGAGVTHTLGTLSIGAQRLIVNAGSQVSSGTAGLTFGATTLTGAATFEVGSSASLTLGAVDGAYALTKEGGGTLTLGTTSTRTTTAGSTTLNAGTLRLTAAGALNTSSSAGLTLAGGTLQVAADSATTFTGTATTVAGDTTVVSDRTSTGAGVTHTLGSLSIGAKTLGISAGSSVTSGTAGITFGATTLTGAATFNVGSGAQLTMGAVGGAYGLNKDGAGTLVLGTTSTRTTTAGTTTLNNGTLRLTTANALNTSSSAGLTLAGGVLQVASNSGTTFNGTATAVTGNVTITSDRASSGAAVTHTLGTLSIGNKTLTVTRGSSVTSGTGGITFGATTLTGNATFAPGSNAQLTLGAITETGGARSLTMSGVGTLILNGAAAYTGGTTISSGTLQIGNGSTTGSLTGNIVNNGAIVINRINSTLSLTGDISGTGGITKTGTSSSPNYGIVELSGNNTFSGDISLSGSRSRLLGSGSSPFGTGTIYMSTSTSIGAIADGSVTVNNVVGGSGTFSIAGASTVTFANSGNSFIGALAISSGGTLIATSNGALGYEFAQLNVNSGTLAFSGGSNGLNYTKGKTVTFGGNGATGRNGAIDNISGDNTFAGTLQLSDASGRIGAATGTKLTLSGSIGEMIAGWGVEYAGPGTVVLSGTNSYTGTSTVSGGVLKVDGSIASGSLTTVMSGATLGGSGAVGALTLESGATLAPGNSPGTLTAGSTIWNGGATFAWELNDAAGHAGTNWDLLAISGTLTLNGSSANPLLLDLSSLRLDDAPGMPANFDPAGHYSFTFLTTDTVNGITGFDPLAFDITLAHFPSGADGTWSVELTNSGRDLTLNYVSAVPEPSTYVALVGAAALVRTLWRRRSVAA